MAELPRQRGFGILAAAGVIARHLEPFGVQLADSDSDADLPDRVLVEKAGDNADPHRFILGRRRREFGWAVALQDHVRGQAAEQALQLAIVPTLVGQEERLPLT